MCEPIKYHRPLYSIFDYLWSVHNYRMNLLITTPQQSNYYTNAALLQLSAEDIFKKS